MVAVLLSRLDARGNSRVFLVGRRVIFGGSARGDPEREADSCGWASWSANVVCRGELVLEPSCKCLIGVDCLGKASVPDGGNGLVL